VAVAVGALPIIEFWRAFHFTPRPLKSLARVCSLADVFLAPEVVLQFGHNFPQGLDDVVAAAVRGYGLVNKSPHAVLGSRYFLHSGILSRGKTHFPGR